MTAVEFIAQELSKQIDNNLFMEVTFNKLLEQAKEMEEQGKVEFAFKAYSEMLSTGKSFVDIVNSMRTFKSE